MHGYGVGRFTAKCRRRAAAPRCLLAFYILDALLPSSAFSSLSPRITLFAIRTPRYLSFRAVHIDRPARARGTGIRVKPPFLTRLDDPLPRPVSLAPLSVSSLAGSLSSPSFVRFPPCCLSSLAHSLSSTPAVPFLPPRSFTFIPLALRLRSAEFFSLFGSGLAMSLLGCCYAV